jgi:hypothetical protein
MLEVPQPARQGQVRTPAGGPALTSTVDDPEQTWLTSAPESAETALTGFAVVVGRVKREPDVPRLVSAAS